MPDKNEEITVRIVSNPYIVGNDVYCNVQLWGNPNEWTYRMKFGKTLWHSIYEHLSELENDPFNILMGDSAFKIDEGLEYLNGRIITIRGVSDSKMSFKTKEGKLEYGKKFIVEFKGDLEEVERIGGDAYKKALFETVLDNTMGINCIVANSDLAKFEIEKAKEKELKKEEKKKEKENKEKEKEEKKKKQWENSKVEWVVKKREEDKKNVERMKQLELAGW